MIREQAFIRSDLVRRTLLVWIGLISVLGPNTLGQSTTSRSGSIQPNTSARDDAHEPAAEGSDQIMKAYGDAQPYMECTLPQLRRIVPALEGLKSDKGQLQLQSILKRTGEVIQAQVPKMPDLIARESVAQVDVTGAKSPETGALSQTSAGIPSGHRPTSTIFVAIRDGREATGAEPAFDTGDGNALEGFRLFDPGSSVEQRCSGPGGVSHRLEGAEWQTTEARAKNLARHRF